MALFARVAVFVFARRLMPGLGEMLIAAPAASTISNEHALAGGSEIGERFVGLTVVDHRTDRDLQNHVRAGVAGAIGAFTVASAVGFEFTIVAITEKRVVVRVGFEINAAAVAAIAAARTAAGDIFFAAERDTTVSAVAGFYEYFCFVNEHWNSFFRCAPEIPQVSAPDNKKRSLPGQRPRRRSSRSEDRPLRKLQFAAGTMLMKRPRRPLSSNFTWPVTSANNVSSLPCPTFSPA